MYYFFLKIKLKINLNCFHISLIISFSDLVKDTLNKNKSNINHNKKHAILYLKNAIKIEVKKKKILIIMLNKNINIPDNLLKSESIKLFNSSQYL